MDFGSEHQTAMKMVEKSKKIPKKSDTNIVGN